MGQKRFLTPRPPVFNLCLLPVASPAHARMKPPPLSTGPETPHCTGLDELASTGFISFNLKKQQQQQQHEIYIAKLNRTGVRETLSSCTRSKQKKEEALASVGESAALHLFDCSKTSENKAAPSRYALCFMCLSSWFGNKNLFFMQILHKHRHSWIFLQTLFSMHIIPAMNN